MDRRLGHIDPVKLRAEVDRQKKERGWKVESDSDELSIVRWL